MTYLDRIKQAKDSVEMQKNIFDVISLAKDEAFAMWLDEKYKATAMSYWLGPATIKVLDKEVEG